MKYKEEVLKSRKIYKGRIFDVRVDEVKLPSGKKAKREVVIHPGAVAIIAITSDGKIVLVRQYRHPTEKELYELPAGKLDLGLNVLETAKRELKEETGYEAKKWKKVYECWTTPGFSNERMHFFVAEGLRKSKKDLDFDEFMDVLEIKVNKAVEMIKNGQIEDAKTSVGIFLVFFDNIKRS